MLLEDSHSLLSENGNGYNHVETIWHYLMQTKYSLSMTQQFHSRIYFIMCAHVHQMYRRMFFGVLFINVKRKLEMTQIPITHRVDKL